MASKFYIQHCVDGSKRRLRRATKQGRKPSGLANKINVRLWQDDMEIIQKLAEIFGKYWNLNEFIRSAVHEKLSNSVYTELLKS